MIYASIDIGNHIWTKNQEVLKLLPNNQAFINTKCMCKLSKSTHFINTSIYTIYTL